MTATFRKDSDIQKDILAELKWVPEIDEAGIGVIVKDCAVTLTGTVPKYSDKEAAKRAVKRIKGVRAIADDIEVKLASETAGSDEDIAHQISSMFAWNVQIPGDDVKADVRNGIIYLEGVVKWQYQKDYIKRHVENMKGVKAVINNIKIKKQITSGNIKDKINKALHRHANVEAKNIKVSVANGIVTLDGKVDTYFDMDLIEDAVWSAKGVTEVVGNLKVA